MLKDAYRRHPWLVSALAVTTALTLYFAISFMVKFVYWTTHRQEQIQPWMTVGYVGHSWGLNPRLIDQVAGLPMPIDHPLTLNEIAKQRGVPVEQVVKSVEEAVAQLKAIQK